MGSNLVAVTCKQYFKTRTPESLKKYRKQKLYIKKTQNILQQSKRVKYYLQHKTFWKNIQPIFSQNHKVTNKITLVGDNENIISDGTLVSEELFFFLKCHQSPQLKCIATAQMKD